VDAYAKTAAACFDMAQNCVRSIVPNAALTYRQRKLAEYEVVCVLIHFLSRVLFDNDPAFINERMSAISTAALRVCTQAARDAIPLPPSGPVTYDPPDYGANNKIFTRELYEQSARRLGEQIYRDRLDTVTADTTETFMNLYCDRMWEYTELGDDWFRLLLVRFGKHLVEVVDPDDDHPKIFFNCELEAVKMFDALGDYSGDILATPAT
jgi:hypothetical protein